MRPKFTWPVYGFSQDRRTETVATFFDWFDAASFAMHPERYGADKRSLYLDEPHYDRRERGYRPEGEPA